MDIQIHEAQRTPDRLDLNRVTLRHIVIKLSKNQRQNVESSKKKEKLQKGLLAELSTEISETRMR